MSSVVAVFVIAAYLFTAMSSIFLALIKRRPSTSYLAAGLSILLIHFSLLELGVYDVTVSTGLPLFDDFLRTFTSLLVLMRLVISVSGAVFLSLSIFSLGMELKPPQLPKKTDYYKWSDSYR